MTLDFPPSQKKKKRANFLMYIRNLKKEDELCSKTLNSKKCDIVLDDFIKIQFLSQTWFSQWKFHLNRLSKKSSSPDMTEEIVISAPEDTPEEEHELDSFSEDEKGSKKSLAKAISAPSAHRGSLPCDKDSNLQGPWVHRPYPFWTNSDVLEWLDHIYYTKKQRFSQIENLTTIFTHKEISGKILKLITAEQELKEFDLGITECIRLYDEILYLRKKNDLFDRDRYLILKKYCDKSENKFTYDIDELKQTNSHCFDLDNLCSRIILILFNIPLDKTKKWDQRLREFVTNLESPLPHFRFMVKVLAVDSALEPNFFEKIGKRILASKMETFFHIGLLIKNLQLDWFTNELVHIGPTCSKRPLICVDVDCLCVETNQIVPFIERLAKEVIRWNRDMRYVSYRGLHLTKKSKKANCQDFVHSLLQALKHGKDFVFPRTIVDFFDKMKNAEIPRKEFVLTDNFREMFKIDDFLMEMKNPKIHYAEEDVSPLHIIEEGNENMIVFRSHCQLDLFFWHCIMQGRYMFIDFFGEYELLKSFDRAFHIASYYAKKKGIIKENALTVSQCKRGCPFNVSETKKHLLVDHVDIDEKTPSLDVSERFERVKQKFDSPVKKKGGSDKCCII